MSTVTVTGAERPTTNWRGGPFITSNGDLYIFAGTATPGVGAFRSADDGATWAVRTEVTAASARPAISVVQNGDTFYVLAAGASAAAHAAYSYVSGTDTWTTLTSPISSPAGARTVALARRSDGDLVAFYNKTTVANMAVEYERVAYKVSTDGGATWGTETALGLGAATTANSETVQDAVLGASDRVHFFWFRTVSVAASQIWHQTLLSTENSGAPATAAQSPGTAQGSATTTAAIVASTGGGAYDGTNLVVPFPDGATGHAAQLTGAEAASPTWTQTTVGDLGHVMTISALTGATQEGPTVAVATPTHDLHFILWGNTTNLYRDSNTVLNTGITDVAQESGVASNLEALTAAFYTRSGADRVGYAFSRNGVTTVVFGEYSYVVAASKSIPYQSRSRRALRSLIVR